jgi:hypothetical protein
MVHIESKLLGIMVAVALCFAFFVIPPVHAGEPDQTIGGINPNHYVCVDEQNRVVDLDSDAVTVNSDGTATFDPDKTVDLDDLKGECKEKEDELNENLTVTLVRQSRVEGFVVEFHLDPGAPGGWRGVFSRDVPVVIFGPGFEVFQGSDKDGSFYFDNLGAGPVTFNLRLPPDAHAINPNVTVVTNGFFNTTSGIYLGFYRGDMPGPDFETIVSPDGVPLAPANFTFEDLEGSNDALNDLTGMPNVGGVLSTQPSIYTISLAVVVLLALPIAGVLKLRRARFKD